MHSFNTAFFKTDNAGLERKERVIAAPLDIGAGAKSSSALPYQDAPRQNLLTAGAFHPESF